MLPEQAVHVVDEAEYESGRERKLHVLTIDPGVARRGENRRSEPETEQDDDEIDEGLDCQMNGERRSTKRRPERRRQNEDFESRQNAPDQRADERAARRAIRSEQRTAARRDVHFRMDRAENRCDRGEPEHDPKLAGRLGKRHRGRTLEWGATAV